MTGLVLCAVAGLLCLVAGYRSRVAGLIVVLAVGYVYGITRAHAGGPFAHFIFDAGLVGLYLSEVLRRYRREDRLRARRLRLWVALLVSWPLLLFLVPQQHPLIQLVGLRGAILFVPLLLIGARYSDEEMYRLALWVAGLNVAAAAFAVVQFFVGVEQFFPATGVTRIIHNSSDVAGGELRIPSFFSSAHAFAGTMVVSVPLVAGAWIQRAPSPWVKNLLTAGVLAALAGVFLAATRSNVLLLAVLMVAATFTGRLGAGARIGWVLMILGLGWVVAQEERLQRFTTLGDTDFVSERVALSVNEGFLDLLVKYPLGNGLGGGGTSLPFFLEALVENRIWIENEYARLFLELGIPGLVLWVVFVVWALSRRTNHPRDTWFFGRRLAWVAVAALFAMGFIGTGLLTAIPQTALLLFYMGWISVPRSATLPRRVHLPGVPIAVPGASGFR